MFNIIINLIIIWLLISVLSVVFERIFFKNRSKLKDIKEEIERKTKCPPHKWTYRDNQPMQCTKCNFVAGSHDNGFGNYNF